MAGAESYPDADAKIDRLVGFLLEHFPDEGPIVDSVDVAIRLLARYLRSGQAAHDSMRIDQRGRLLYAYGTPYAPDRGEAEDYAEEVEALRMWDADDSTVDRPHWRAAAERSLVEGDRPV